MLPLRALLVLLCTLCCHASSTGLAAHYQYALDAAGQRVGLTERHRGRSVSYAYDQLGRLSEETIAFGGFSRLEYSYDAVGNRQSRLVQGLLSLPTQALAYDSNDRLTTATYDQNGNPLLYQGAQNAYDHANRLISHQGGSASMVYDADGNLVQLTRVGGSQVSYLVDTLNPTGYAQVIAEIPQSGPIITYSYGLDLVARHLAEDTQYYCYDGHGSVRALATHSGHITDTYDYDAYGNLIAHVGSSEQPYLYAGERWVPELGLYYNRARYMDPAVGRFLTMDEFEGYRRIALSQNKYLYGWCDPINTSDPSGNSPLPPHWIAFAGRVSGAVAFTIYVGWRAHIAIGEDYRMRNNYRPNIIVDRSISTILSVPGLSSRRPDIADSGRREVYEIKSGAINAVQAVFNARKQASDYIDLLNQNDPRSSGNPDYGPGPWKMGTSYNPQGRILELDTILPLSIKVYLEEPGVVTYYPDNRFYVYMLLSEVLVHTTKRIGFVSAFNATRLQGQLAINRLLASMGFAL